MKDFEIENLKDPMDDEDDNSVLETTLKDLCSGSPCIPDEGTVGGGTIPPNNSPTVSI